MRKEIHILMLEDRLADAELAMHELQREGMPFTAKRVSTEADFLAELRNAAPDLILADNSLPSYDGLSALKFAHEKHPEIPFLFVSGHGTPTRSRRRPGDGGGAWQEDSHSHAGGPVGRCRA